MPACFIAPTLPSPARRPRSCTRHRTPVACSASPEQGRRRISRRSFLALSLLPLPALASFPDIDDRNPTEQAERASATDGILHTPQQRFGIDGHTHATHEDYLHALHVDDPPHVARIFLARAAVAGYVAAFCAAANAVSERESLRNPLPRLYDRHAVHNYFAVRPDKVVRRMALFAREFTAFGLRWGLQFSQRVLDCVAVKNGLHTSVWARLREEHRQLRRARLLREAIARLGTAVIKLGQAAASRQDLFGVGVIRELQHLQDDILEFFPTAKAFALVEEDLGAPPTKLFTDFDPVPVAGASLGMVFSAHLGDTRVAVKVQRPEVAENVALDCYIVRWMASMATFVLGSRTDLTCAVDEYASRLYEELDYRNELDNMIKFRELYGDTEGIYVPQAFPDYCSQRVLVTEWVDGVKLIDEDARVRSEDLGIVETGIRFALTQLLDKGFLHADMHNGNMMRTKSGYLAYIDFGLVSEVPAAVRESLCCALMQLIHGEYTQLAQSFVGLAVMNTDDLDLELPLLSEALRDALEPKVDPSTTSPAPAEVAATAAATGTTSDYATQIPGVGSPLGVERLEEFTLIGIVGRLLEVGTRFPFVFSDYFLSNLRCLAMLEGLALAADPSFSIVKVVYPHVARKLMSGSSPRLHRAFTQLVLDSYGRLRWSRMERLLRDATGGGKGTDRVLEYLTSTHGCTLRRYLASEMGRTQQLRGERFVDRTIRGIRETGATTTREVSDGEARARTKAFFHGVPLTKRARFAARVGPEFVAALLVATARVFVYFLLAVAERMRAVGKRGSGGASKDEDIWMMRVRAEWRMFPSRFARRCAREQQLGVQPAGELAVEEDVQEVKKTAERMRGNRPQTQVAA